MVSASDVIKFYESDGSLDSLGGDIRTTIEIASGTDNNLFDAVTKSQIAGAPFDQYKCFYIKNISDEEIRNVSIWVTSGTPSDFTSVQWALEPSSTAHRYQHQPYMSFTGDDHVNTGIDTNRIQFTLAAWFAISATPLDNYVMIGKGVNGSETSADNWNCVLAMDTLGQVFGGFEESGGTNHFATSPTAYNDGEWHLAVVTYNQVAVKLYVDGTEVASHSTTTIPNTNSHFIKIGTDSSGTANTWWIGELDQTRIWSNDIQAAEVTSLYQDGIVPDTDNIIYSNVFGSNNNSRIAQEIPNISTAPTGVTWQGGINQPTTPNIGKLGPDGYRPIWVKWRVEANCPDIPRDRCIFNYTFDITTTGTGSDPTPGGGGGGGSGGNPNPTPNDWKIAVVGDWGEEDETDDVVGMILDEPYDLVIGTGDNSYTSSDSEWYSGVIKPIDDNQGSPIRFETANGNHDSGSNIRSHFGYKNTYTSFDFENVHVLILDTESDMDIGSAQHNFAKADLEKQDSRSNIDWIFVAMHHPMLGPDSDHDVNEFDQVQNYMDMFLEHNVTMVFQGHNHHWFRSYPVRRNGSSASRVSSSNGPYTVGEPNNWLIAVTSGTGGHDSGSSLYDLNSEPSYSAYQNNTNNGIFSIVASNEGQTLTCKFINTSNSTKHTFVINRTE